MYKASQSCLLCFLCHPYIPHYNLINLLVDLQPSRPDESYSYIIIRTCMHIMLLSPNMQYADGNSWAVYGVTGIGQTSDCGCCYQLEITCGGSASPNKYIVQAVNTGSDVSSGQFDILVGAGGLDAYSSDCQYGQVCSDGHCNSPYYSSDFNAWTPDGNCYGGGIHDPSGCSKLVTNSSCFPLQGDGNPTQE